MRQPLASNLKLCNFWIFFLFPILLCLAGFYLKNILRLFFKLRKTAEILKAFRRVYGWKRWPREIRSLPEADTLQHSVSILTRFVL